MPEHQSAPDPLEKLGYDPRDISLPALVKWMVGLAAFVAVSAIIAYITYQMFAVQTPGRTLSVFANNPQPPPEPRIQGFPERDMRAFRQNEDREVNGYGWVDRSKGVVRIPIERAMDLTLQRGLPARPQPPQPQKGTQR